MGSLSGDVLQVLDPATGDISDAGRAAFIADTQMIMAVGPAATAGMIAIAGTDAEFNITEMMGVVSLGIIGTMLAAAFGRPTLEEHMTDYEAWHRIIVDGIYKDLAQQFDITSQYPLMPIFDPTFLVPPIINWIEINLKLNLDINIDLDMVLGLGWIPCMPTLLADCEGFLCMTDSVGDNGHVREKFEEPQDPDSADNPVGEGEPWTFCDLFPIEIPFPPPFVIPPIPSLPSWAIPGIPGIPPFDLNFPPAIPTVPSFAIALGAAIPEWLINLALEFTVEWMELLPCIPCFIEWVIMKIIDLIILVMEAIAGYIAFVASIIVIIKHMVVWVAVDLVVALLGPGMIADLVATLLGA